MWLKEIVSNTIPLLSGVQPRRPLWENERRVPLLSREPVPNWGAQLDALTDNCISVPILSLVRCPSKLQPAQPHTTVLWALLFHHSSFIQLTCLLPRDGFSDQLIENSFRSHSPSYHPLYFFRCTFTIWNHLIHVFVYLDTVCLPTSPQGKNALRAGSVAEHQPPNKVPNKVGTQYFLNEWIKQRLSRWRMGR